MSSGAHEFRRDAHPLPSALSCAVPLWAAKLCSGEMGDPFDPAAIGSCLDRLQMAREALLFRVPGKSADGFNALAEGLARLAFFPGGVKAFGMWWEYSPGNWIGGKHGVPIPGDDPAAQDPMAVARLLSERVRVRRPG